MRSLILILALSTLIIGRASAAPPGNWLLHAAGALGYDRCGAVIKEIEQKGIFGQPVGKNLETARQLPGKHFLGGFVEAMAGEQSRHHTFTLGENQSFLCEGRLVTSYVEPLSCDVFIQQYLTEGKLLGEMNAGRTRVFFNSPYQLYVTQTAAGDSCLVTGVQRFGGTDPRSDCAYRDIDRGAVELCLIYRGTQAPVLSLKLNDEPVLVLREDLTDRFELSHPGAGKGEKPVVIAGHCQAEDGKRRPPGRTCTLQWGGRELFTDVRLGLKK